MGIWLIRISVIYLFLGTALGMYMSITEDFELSSVHTHISLIGWTTMTLAGIIYYIFPKLAQSILCKIQFILFNIGLPIMLIGLALFLSGPGSVVVVSVGATITSIAILIFTINVLTGLKSIPDFKSDQE
ncbi:MAG: cytochrome-c oxidase [Deltaproteobacteria bacterium]|jgi:cbb3-type cytochrome oxidase subunit 1|nr:MAG: cytochrome-c oxidase [Deltaproteobacteria bacterium]